MPEGKPKFAALISSKFLPKNSGTADVSGSYVEHHCRPNEWNLRLSPQAQAPRAEAH